MHFIALFRSIEDGIAFDRIEHPKSDIFEFFVAAGCQTKFIEIMELFLKQNIIEYYSQESLEYSSLNYYQ